MAGLGVGHAMCDFTSNPLAYFGIGLLVGCFVLIIDRAIIATYEKKEKGVCKQFWWRLFLSVVMGFNIALFCIFFFFQNRIDDQLRETNIKKEIKIRDYYQEQENIITKELNERKNRLSFDKIVRQAEKDGVKKHSNLVIMNIQLQDKEEKV